MIFDYSHIIDVKNESILAGRLCCTCAAGCRVQAAMQSSAVYTPQCSSAQQLAGFASARLYESRTGAGWLSSITSASSRIGGRCTLHFCAVM